MKHSRSFLKDLYRTMVRIRACEESFVAPIVAKEILCPVHLYSGQEAIATGVCAALNPDDYIFGTHRSHGHYLAKGGSLRQLVAEVYCRETGCSKGRGGSMHVTSPANGVLGVAPIVGGTVALAVGAALASKVRGDGRIAVAFFGDGAAGEGVLTESLNLAALLTLPVIFVCENNLYSTHLPIRECRPDVPIAELASPFGIPNRQIDGNDVLEVFDTARTAVTRARRGDGPAFIECLTYRLRGHVGPDDFVQGVHDDIRPPAEIERWRKKDPIPKFERYLRKSHHFSETELNTVKDAIDCEIKEAHAFARNSPWPKPEELARYVYANQNHLA